MKNLITGIAVLASVSAFAFTAQANNATVENALKDRSDLSSFYNGLVSTGVINELKEGQPYTVFAPTNEAFAQITQDKYPCFYSADCKAHVAEILRRHIVPGEKHLSDITAQGGEVSMFSIDNQHVVASEPNKGSFTVDGRNVLSENQLLGGDLYKIDGVMVSDHDMAQFVAPQIIVVHAAGTDLPPATPPGQVITYTTTTRDATTPIPY
jgi:uncharacterized surface protein with fasciclin (FAS1) repeats